MGIVFLFGCSSVISVLLEISEFPFEVCFATIWNETHTETYEVLANRRMTERQKGESIYVLIFPEAKAIVNAEYAVPYDFMEDKMFTLPI